MQAQDIRRFLRADQGGATGAGFDQDHAAQDQRAHDAVAEFGLRDHDAAQMVRRDEERLHVLNCINVNQCGPAGELTYFSDEITRAFLHDGSERPKPVATLHFHTAAPEHWCDGFGRCSWRYVLGPGPARV